MKSNELSRYYIGTDFNPPCCAKIALSTKRGISTYPYALANGRERTRTFDARIAAKETLVSQLHAITREGIYIDPVLKPNT